MDRVYQVTKVNHPVRAAVEIPGSKSITNRALLLAALSDGPVQLENLLMSDDGRHFLQCLQELGFKTETELAGKRVRIWGKGGKIPKSNATINVGSAGTAARFLTAVLALSEGEFLVEASDQMKARPMKSLLESLMELGARFEYLEQPGCLPYRIIGAGQRGGKVKVSGNISSQFLSALLLAGGINSDGLELELVGELVAKPFVRMTLKMMADFGVRVEWKDEANFYISKGQSYRARDYQIEPDLSNACYFWSLAVLTGGRILVQGSSRDSLQGDVGFLKVLEQLGAKVEETEAGILVNGPEGGRYPGIQVDLGDMPDQALTLAVLAPFAESDTLIQNIGLIRHHESNRLEALITELARVGIGAEAVGDGVLIHPGTVQAGTIETYDDHRMAMAFSLLGVRASGIEIKNPECTAKTFGEYFQVFEQVLKG